MAKTNEKRLAQQRLCKRRKYAEIKNDPELYKAEREKQRAKYLKRKEKKLQLSIADKSPREQKQIRKRWRENTKKYRQKKKEEKCHEPISLNTVYIDAIKSENPLEPAISERYNPIRLFTADDLEAEQRRIQYEERKKRLRLIGIVKNLKEINRNQTLTITRLKSIITKHRRSKMQAEDAEKQNLMDKVIEYLQNRRIQRCTRDISLKSQNSSKFQSLRQNVVEEIENFYNDDSNSTVCVDKKEFITNDKITMQIRYLKAPLNMLHRKLLAETNIKVSYSFFTKLRPFWVLLARSSQREVY